VPIEEVDLNKGISEEDLDRLIGKRDYRPFLNQRNELYRERKMNENPPSREEAIRLMAAHPNLIRRPLIVDGTRRILGFDEAEYKELVK
jgi:arsenate reductase-like glutaredoxin family protein